MRIGIYPGSFDPLTNGHLDIIKRAQGLCDKLIIAIACNSQKKPLFDIKEREQILQDVFAGNDKIKITSFKGLTAEYCKKNNVSVIIRGLRAIVDYEYECAIALMNKKLAPEVETVFLMANSDYAFLSSQLVKEVASYNGDITSLVPQDVLNKLSSKYSR